MYADHAEQTERKTRTANQKSSSVSTWVAQKTTPALQPAVHQLRASKNNGIDCTKKNGGRVVSNAPYTGTPLDISFASSSSSYIREHAQYYRLFTVKSMSGTCAEDELVVCLIFSIRRGPGASHYIGHSLLLSSTNNSVCTNIEKPRRLARGKRQIYRISGLVKSINLTAWARAGYRSVPRCHRTCPERRAPSNIGNDGGKVDGPIRTPTGDISRVRGIVKGYLGPCIESLVIFKATEKTLQPLLSSRLYRTFSDDAVMLWRNNEDEGVLPSTCRRAVTAEKELCFISPEWSRLRVFGSRYTELYFCAQPFCCGIQLTCQTARGQRNYVGALVAERLACSLPTKAIRVQSPAGSLRISACGNRAGRCRFPSPFIPALLHSHLNHPYRLSRPRWNSCLEGLKLLLFQCGILFSAFAPTLPHVQSYSRLTSCRLSRDDISAAQTVRAANSAYQQLYSVHGIHNSGRANVTVNSLDMNPKDLRIESRLYMAKIFPSRVKQKRELVRFKAPSIQGESSALRQKREDVHCEISVRICLSTNARKPLLGAECVKCVWRHVTARSREPMRVMEVSMEQRRNERAEQTGESGGEPGSILGRVTPGCSYGGIVQDDAADRRVFSGFSRLPRPFIPVQPHTHLSHPYRLSRPRFFVPPLSLRAFGGDSLLNFLRAQEGAHNQLRSTRTLVRNTPHTECVWKLNVMYSTDDNLKIKKKYCESMRVIEASMQQRRNERAGETGDTRENSPTSGIVRHDSHVRKSGGDPAGGLSPVRIGGARAG
ncbi:hypothetical protein PR048_003684 [Dryococelus australis]|uniref:Uncharacterized protein n=1 Tax=Dryococelus australis TaxID=614101 RepID=A0ABQ9INU9_9NEOP|nr:hypothetical protein PR048_003684 [Dryococelus australis]